MADDVRSRIGGVGCWYWQSMFSPSEQVREAVSEIEALGYGSLWYGEGHRSREAMATGGMLLAATRRIVVAVGIANIWVRDPIAMAAGARTLAEGYPDRFLLGLGVSHQAQVDHRGHRYRKPVGTMRDYLDAMDSIDYGGPAPATPAPRVLAALRPRMLELARDRADGAHPCFVPVEHTRRAREILGPQPLLCTEQPLLLERDPWRARELIREYMAWFLQMPNYRNNLLWLGFEEDDFADGGSDRLVDELVAWGDDEDLVTRVREHLDAGADHVCVQALPRRIDQTGLETLRTVTAGLMEL